MAFTLEGTLVQKENTVDISASFKKREFVIEVPNERNSDWNDFVKFQLTQDRCDLIDIYNQGDALKISFNVRGRKWEKNGQTNFITNLEAWRVEKVSQQASAPQDMPLPEYSEDDIPPAGPEDDLPF